MARCYHDKQDFKSDVNIEVAREGDILLEGQDLDEIKCTKNPGHRGFIPFKDLSLEYLPNEYRNREMLDSIKKIGSAVVRLVVDKIKNGRMIRDAGSGIVYKFHNMYCIKTNNHVVKTEDDVKHCTVEFHYDDDDRSNVFTSRGVKLERTCPYRDVTHFEFHPVPDFLHQLDWRNDKLPDMVILYKNCNQIVTVKTRDYIKSDMSQLNFISHLNLNSPLIELMCFSWPDSSISYMKSSCFQFQPIPSSIKELTSIEIHIDEDDGDSRVIPGDVVKLGDEFVVKISESIFQDEVKKCRLVWNGDFIGRGTRLYFEQVKTSDILCGIDLEVRIAQGIENYSIIEFYPIPRYLQQMLLSKRSGNMCCIGHPHGGIKMVTFGRMLGNSLKRFDNQGRPITNPNPDCRCKEVGCVSYLCKTCPGSSGSPVFLLHEEIDLCPSSNHFLTERVEGFLSNGELRKNINIAWTSLPPN